MATRATDTHLKISKARSKRRDVSGIVEDKKGNVL